MVEQYHRQHNKGPSLNELERHNISAKKRGEELVKALWMLTARSDRKHQIKAQGVNGSFSAFKVLFIFLFC